MAVRSPAQSPQGQHPQAQNSGEGVQMLRFRMWLSYGGQPAEGGGLLNRHQPAPTRLGGVQLTARCASASTWTVVVAGPPPTSDTVFLHGAPYGM